MVQQKELIKAMTADMRIFPYNNEEVKLFQSRLVYSAMAEWIRHSILDKTNKDDKELKSKKYIRNKGNEVLDALLKVFPYTKEYFYYDKPPTDYHPVVELRERMIKSEELLELFDGIGLNSGVGESINKKYNRMFGIDTKAGVKNVGITRIVATNRMNEINIGLINSKELFEHIIKSTKWEGIEDKKSVEIFNPTIKKPPYQCWDNQYKLENDTVYLGRILVTNYLYDYYWIKFEKNKYYISKVNEYLAKFNEIRRFMSLRRKENNNALQLYAEIFDDVVFIKLYSRVPLREEVILDTYGWPLNNINDKSSYIIPIELWDEVKKMFIFMNYEVEEKHNGRI